MECTLDLLGRTNPDAFIKLRAIPFVIKETKKGVRYAIFPPDLN